MRYFKWFEIVFMVLVSILIIPGLQTHHIFLIMYLPCFNLLRLLQCRQEFLLKVFENKMAPFPTPADLDTYKMNSIETEFHIFICSIIVRIIHFLTIMYCRCWNFSIFDGFIFGKMGTDTFSDALTDLVTYSDYRIFLYRLRKRTVVKTFGENKDEICPICQETMVSGIQMKMCPHVYHQYCIVRYIQKGGEKCPMCRQSILEDEEE
jgi:hypothetical protein